ncbi:MAG: hypothetical protein ACP5PM_08450 [Acidimicrobiales bacterium]
MTSIPIVTVEILAASVWIGSLVCLAIVSQAARTELDAPARAALFRAVGRRYAIVGTGSLLVAIGDGLAMAWPPAEWSATVDSAVGLAGLLVLATAAGMAQARMMGTLQRRVVRTASDPAARHALRRGRKVATALRLAMAGATLAVVVLAAMAMSR